jgi:hypothetical protein
VIYRELFPSGLTLLDKGQLGELGTSHLVARQELRALVANLRLPAPGARAGNQRGRLTWAACCYRRARRGWLQAGHGPLAMGTEDHQTR